ncbi:hypothetical protein [Histophilus somni]|uniref:hypothetical protein n=1 Tax=Histophilus somni TaxID=731 RepID=UPI00201EC0FF|nr:hypothetical protein [Histophilus somni]
MKKYTLEVKIAERGTSYKGHSSSVAGHIFYVLVDEHGNRKSFGWGKGENSTLGGIENITKTDDIDYSETKEGKIHTTTFNITEKQYNILLEHGDNPFHDRLFGHNYDVLNNSCVDYVFVGLHKAGINPYAYEGKLIPSTNIDVINEFKNGNFRLPLTPYGISLRQREIIDQVNARMKEIEGNKKAINNFDISTTPILDKNSNNDAVSLSHALYAMVDKDKLNKFNDPVSVSSSHIITNGFQPANHNIAHRAFSIKDMSEFSSLKVHPSLLNRIRGIGYAQDPVDPLILDLNGDGARAVSYTEKPVLFDIDNDGGSLEETGWLSHQDGLLVRDLNNNGKIDNMSEVFSEYYAGRAGRNGEAGEKPFANGFEALKSLDSNKDNVFDSKDRDFNAVRVWQDANHNGVTDKRELKTLKQLGITAIKLDYEEKGGQLFNGNELLAKGSFTRNGKQQEVVAVNFLANPRGHRISNANGGKKTVTEASGLIQGTTGWTAVDDVNRDLSAVTLGVENIQAGMVMTPYEAMSKITGLLVVAIRYGTIPISYSPPPFYHKFSHFNYPFTQNRATSLLAC